MPIVDAIAAIRARKDLDEDRKRRDIYDLKVTALIDVIINGRPRVKPLLGRTVTHKGFTFRINAARATDQPALFLDVTFTRPPGQPVTHQITIVNPPVLPAARTGNEKRDLMQALHEMLEGFV
jgi:hypothetical protein